MTTQAPVIPPSYTQSEVARFLAGYLELQDGLYLWRRGFDAREVQASIDRRWGVGAWRRIRRQAWRLAAGETL